MKKTTLIVTLIFCLSIVLSAQNSTDPIYIILTSKTNVEDGIGKVINQKKSLDKTPAIFYFVTARSKNIHLIFKHYDYNPTELAKVRKVKSNDQMGALVKPVSFLKTITPIDLDVLFPTWTKAQAEAFRDSLQGKKIYIIDRSEIKDNQIELVEVTCHKPSF